MCGSVNVCTHTGASTHGGPKRVLDPLQLGYRLVVGCSVRVLGSEVWSSGRTAAGALNH